ncbi:MAG: gamma-glutamyltransferase [Myxococcales bacterium]|nr:gamma-glutamyltransferase [Myxococcales bacterium]MDH5305897.1 gamma-glutamyltransferase [Myxococcales bacterium]MDH5567851.1 gamma-glutamyltransferase [Myxococcales bacterium]
MRGVVATGHPSVSEVAASMLREGGNAFDAAIAAGFAAAVAEPMLTSLGGGGFLLSRSADRREVLFDFFADTPGRGLPADRLEPHLLPVEVHFSGSDQIFHVGLGSVAVPGALAGLLHVQAQCGRLPLEQIVAPAERMAREGVVVNPVQAYALELLERIITLTPAARALFAPAGRPPRAGERLRNPDLARFLTALPRTGADSLYGGILARRIEADMQGGGGLVGAEDLAHYRVVEREPLEIAYRDCRVLTNPAPSFGGPLIDASLRLLAEVAPTMPAWGTPEHLRCLVAVMVEIEAMRERELVSAAPFSGELGGVCASRVRRAMGGTTHISVADTEGNAASMTLSNGEGSGYVAPDTGIMLNNMLGEDDLHPSGFHASPAGNRVASMMSPCLVLREDRVELIVGSGGSKRIRTALVQAISAVVDHGMDVCAAVESPRLHWDGSCVQLEPGFDPRAVASLERSWPIHRWEERSLYFGGVQAVDPRGTGAGDPRRGGHGMRVE